MGSDRDQWPLSAYIMDPIRAAMVVSGGPARILEVVGWLRSAAAASLGLSVCRIKNGFALPMEVCYAPLSVFFKKLNKIF